MWDFIDMTRRGVFVTDKLPKNPPLIYRAEPWVAMQAPFRISRNWIRSTPLLQLFSAPDICLKSSDRGFHEIPLPHKEKDLAVLWRTFVKQPCCLLNKLLLLHSASCYYSSPSLNRKKFVNCLSFLLLLSAKWKQQQLEKNEFHGLLQFNFQRQSCCWAWAEFFQSRFSFTEAKTCNSQKLNSWIQLLNFPCWF